MLLIHLLAQAAVAAAPQPAAAPAQPEGVISYPASFFAAQNPSNADEMIVRVPGFTIDTGSSVRGYEGAAGNVLIDGQRPSTKTDNLEEILRRISAQQVERIDIIRGGAPGIDMQGKAVIANVIRKQTGGIHGVAAVAFLYTGIDNRVKPQLRLEGNADRDGRHYEASFRTAGYVDDGNGKGPIQRSDGAGHDILNGALSSKGGGIQTIVAGVYSMPAWGGRLHVNGRLFWDDYRYRETDDIALPSHYYRKDFQKQDKFDTELGGSFRRALGPRDNLEIVALRQSDRLGYTEHFDEPGEANVFRQLNDTAETILRGVLKHQHSDALSWETGAEGAYNTLDAQQNFVDNGQNVPLPAGNVRVEEKRWEAFGKGVWQIAKPLTLEAVLKEEGSTISASGDVHLQKSLYFTKPRVMVSWDVDPKTQVRLRYERVVGQLNFSDFAASSSLSTGGVLTAGNPDLNPEQDWVSEAAIERRFLGAGDISLTWRHSEIKDAQDRAPVFTPNGVFDAPANIGDGKKDEYIVEATIPLDVIGIKAGQLRGTGTWRHSEVTDPTTRQKREISGLRPMEWEAHFTQDIPRYRLTWGVDAFGPWRETYYRFDQVETRKLKTWVTLFGEWKPKPDTSVRLEWDNIGERGFRNTVTQYKGPRSTAPIDFIQNRYPKFGQEVFFRVRKTFG